CLRLGLRSSRRGAHAEFGTRDLDAGHRPRQRRVARPVAGGAAAAGRDRGAEPRGRRRACAPAPAPRAGLRRMSAPRIGDAGTWLLAGLASVCLAAMLAFVGHVVASGFAAFWPRPVAELALRDGRVLLGEVVGGDARSIALRGSETLRVGDGYMRILRADVL